MDVPALLAQLIRFDTRNPEGDERGLARFLGDKLAAHAPDTLDVWSVERPGKAPGWNVLARWGTPRVLLNSHMDTVPANDGWTGDPHVARIRDGFVVGLGSADTKGAAAAILAAMGQVAPRNLAVLFSGDEEQGSLCMTSLLAEGRHRGIERAIVCEPTGCRVGVRHRGFLSYRASVQGQGGHSSLADGLPAPVAELARLAVALHGWGTFERANGPEGYKGVCMNVARLVGGVAANVVPDAAFLEWSARPAPGVALEHVADGIESLAKRVLPAAQVVRALAQPSFATRELPAFQALLGDVARTPVDLPYWTEAALLSAAGVDAVVFGPGELDQAHAPDERVSTAQLEQARQVFVRILEQTA